MSRHKLNHNGFTLIELVVVMSLVGIIGTTAFTFFNTTLNQYFGIQREGMVFGDLAFESQRIAKVLRGTTDIVQASSSEITVYAYFAPNDDYASLIHYYKSTDGKIMYAEVTPMTANPPIGTLITASKKTFTIIPSFYSATGVNTFEYQDSAGNTLATPITDLHTIKQIKVTLAVPTPNPTANGNDTVALVVALRNRKTNL